ncbi:MAG: hypothetical protein WBA93_04075 [Microcoleaceae cyanobacterium]
MAIISNSSGGLNQQLHGAVDPDGNKMWGEGFSCRLLGKGAYLVEFDKPFFGQPTAVCTIYGEPWNTFDKSVAIIEINPSYFVCFTSKPGDVLNCAFSFIVFGDV